MSKKREENGSGIKVISIILSMISVVITATLSFFNSRTFILFLFGLWEFWEEIWILHLPSRENGTKNLYWEKKKQIIIM